MLIIKFTFSVMQENRKLCECHTRFDVLILSVQIQEYSACQEETTPFSLILIRNADENGNVNIDIASLPLWSAVPTSLLDLHPFNISLEKPRGCRKGCLSARNRLQTVKAPFACAGNTSSPKVFR